MSTAPVTGEQEHPPIPSAKRGPRPIVGLLLAMCALFAADLLLFHMPVYSYIIEPDSSTGWVETTIHNEHVQQAQHHNLVLTMGDSRFAIAQRIINEEVTPPTGYIFRAGAIPGSSPRIWYYMLRDMDPDRQAYRAIVFGLDDYDDEDPGWDWADDARSIHYLAARLRLMDAIEFAGSYRSWPLRWEAFRDVLFRGLIYQDDLRALLRHPGNRLHDAIETRDHSEDLYYVWSGLERDMKGFAADWDTLKVTSYPPWADEKLREDINNFLLHPVYPQTGHPGEYRRRWLGKMIDRYRNTATKIIFIRLPRGPVVRPGNPVIDRKSTRLNSSHIQKSRMPSSA